MNITFSAVSPAGKKSRRPASPLRCAVVLLLGMLLLPVSLRARAEDGELPRRTFSEARAIALRHLAPSAASRSLASAASLSVDTLRRAYLFTSGGRFVLVSASAADPAVLGYGTAPSAVRPMPAPLSAMLGSASRRPAAAYPPAGAVWTPVAPLLTTVRHQESPYNRYCPHYRSASGYVYPEPCVVGCVATAMEQILTYYRRTYVLADTLHGWTTSRYTIPDVLPGAVIDTRLIRDNYDLPGATEEEIDAVARLSYYLGVACHMNWGVDSSGAQSSRLAESLGAAFGLPYVNYLDSYQYAPADFWNYLAAEIIRRRPVYYAGSIMRTGGHAFVLDGLDADGLFHVNWGYGGDYDGYFRLDVLSHLQPEPDRLGEYVESGFFCNQEAITVSPEPCPEALVPDTLERTGLELAVDSLILPLSPVTGCPTPVILHVRNASAQPLTATLALLLNLPSDTSFVRQADCLAFTGRTLTPGQRDTLLVHLLFPRPGAHLLSATADAVRLLRTVSVSVLEGGTDEVEAGETSVRFEDGTAAVLTQHYRNPSATERAAQSFVYDLLDETAQTDVAVHRYIYLPPDSAATDSVRFRRLVPGRSYTLRLRRRWPVVSSFRFTVPAASAVGELGAEGAAVSEEWYGIDGRRVSPPLRPGVYLRRRGTVVTRHYVK